MKLPCTLLLLLVLLGAPPVAEQTITEFRVPSGGEPNPPRITPGPDGNLWFTVQSFVGPYIGRITPEGAITEFAVDTVPAVQLQITTGSDGNLWFTESFLNANRIGRSTTAGTITEFPIPTPD